MDVRPGSEPIFVTPETDPVDGIVQWADKLSEREGLRRLTGADLREGAADAA